MKNRVTIALVMNTDEQNSPNTSRADSSDRLTGLVGDLQNIDSDSPQASQNETTISDNNGGRIELGEDGRSEDVIRK